MYFYVEIVKIVKVWRVIPVCISDDVLRKEMFVGVFQYAECQVKYGERLQK